MGHASGWSVEGPHGDTSGEGMTREQAIRAAQAEADRVGAVRYAVGPVGPADDDGETEAPETVECAPAAKVS